MRFKSCDTCLCACAFQQQARDPRTAHCVVPRGRGLVAVTREFERDNCVISETLQSDWTIPNRAGVPRKSTKVPRPSFVRESREGLGPRLGISLVPRPLPPGKGSGEFRRISWSNKMAAYWNVNAPIRLQNSSLT